MRDMRDCTWVSYSDNCSDSIFLVEKMPHVVPTVMRQKSEIAKPPTLADRCGSHDPHLALYISAISEAWGGQHRQAKPHRHLNHLTIPLRKGSDLQLYLPVWAPSGALCLMGPAPARAQKKSWLVRSPPNFDPRGDAAGRPPSAATNASKRVSS